MTALFILLVCATSNILAAIVKENIDACSINEFACSDGACISNDVVCDGVPHCADGSDESSCYEDTNLLPGPMHPVLHRFTRQAKCGKMMHQCRDGTCIGFDKKCDGVYDCPDKSDETHALCRNMRCQSNWFRCTYGACVDGTAACNGVQECADNSDEINPKCRSEPDVERGRFKCADGSKISATDKCDGVPNCPDGSDETVSKCASVVCPSYLFQCAYGACVDQGSDCDGKVDCADGSDESDELCNRIGAVTTTSTASPNAKCVLPPYPTHGTYTDSKIANAKPGQRVELFYLNVTCQPGYALQGASEVYCFDGYVSPMPTCGRQCKLNLNDERIEYACVIPDSIYGFRKCKAQEPDGTIAVPSCKKPLYYSSTDLPRITCIDGNWDSSPVCLPECGRITPAGEKLIVGGKEAKHGELPWHVGIYTKNPYTQICGGSIVSNTLVISAAHCFWSSLNTKQPASDYAVAAGKIYRDWDNANDKDAQKSDVAEIWIPDVYYGNEKNFADDIALLILSKPFEYRTYLRPVCLNFDLIFDQQQLVAGNMGKVAGWGLTGSKGPYSNVLKVVDLPLVEIRECLARAPASFRAYLTHDKICAGYQNGTALCKGDSGGGLVFPSESLGVQRYYLRGIVSTAPQSTDECNAYAITSFTRITSHEAFIKQQYKPY